MITSFQQLFREISSDGKQRIVIAGGEDPEALKAVKASFENGFGKAVLMGKEDRIEDSLAALGYQDKSFIENIVPAREEEKAYMAVDEVKKGGIYYTGFPEGNIVVGAGVLIIVPSRAGKSEGKLNSIALSILCSR